MISVIIEYQYCLCCMFLTYQDMFAAFNTISRPTQFLCLIKTVKTCYFLILDTMSRLVCSFFDTMSRPVCSFFIDNQDLHVIYGSKILRPLCALFFKQSQDLWAYFRHNVKTCVLNYRHNVKTSVLCVLRKCQSLCV